MRTAVFEPLSLYDTGAPIRSHDYRNRHDCSTMTIFHLVQSKIAQCVSGFRCDAHGPLTEHLMHIAHKIRKTSGISKSSLDWLKYTGFMRDVCVAFFLPNPLMEEERPCVYNCDDERFSGSTKCEICKVHDIYYLKYVQEFYTPVCYCGNISTPLNMTRQKKQNVIGCFTYQLLYMALPVLGETTVIKLH